MSRWLAPILALLLSASAVAVGGATPVVRSVEIRVEEGWTPPEELADLVSVEVGESLDLERVRQSVRSLRAALEASEVEAHLRHRVDGVDVVFALRVEVRVREVRLSGDLCIKESVLRGFVDQQAGSALSESRLLRGLYSLQDHHLESGYLDASVRLAVEGGAEAGSGEAVVAYEIVCGRVASVGSVSFEGDREPLGAAELIAQLAVGPGERYFERGVRRDAERLEEWLLGEGYREARVAAPKVVYEADTTQVHLTYGVELGSRFEVRLSGADADQLERADLLPLQGLERYDEALLRRDLARLRSYFQTRGHYRVRIDTRTEESPGLRRLWVLVEPGPLFELVSVEWSGLESISAQRLEELAVTSASRRFVGGPPRLIDQELEQDLDAVRSRLALLGFDRAEVGPAAVDVSGSELRVRVPVEQGPQRQVVHLTLAGVVRLDELELRSQLPLREGGPFNPVLLEESLNAIRARYQDLGFARVQASATESWNVDETLVDVSLRVLEGPRTTVERVILRGQVATGSATVMRAVDLQPGDAVSRNDLLRVQRRLYALGVFSSVEVDLAPGAPLSGRRDVVIRVREGRTRKVSYGFGWDSEDGVRGLFGYSRSNLFGRAMTARVDLRWSERDQQARLLLFEPFVGRFRLPTTASLFAIEEQQDSFLSKRAGFQLESSKLFERSRFNLLYTYKTVDAEPDESFAALPPEELARVVDIDRDLQDVKISSIRPAWLVDRRDDPVLPRRGWSSTLSAEYAFPFLETDAQFFKAFTQQTAYRSLGAFGVLAASLRLGAIEPLDEEGPDSALPETLPSRLIPISERFFAGGRSSHRAYRRDRLGEVGEARLESDGVTVSVGGNGLMLVNLDYRFPIAGPVEGVAFVDAGNVWADWRSIDPAGLKLGVGGGVRYASPIGPLRLEVGWKLDREPGESPAVVFLSFGNPF